MAGGSRNERTDALELQIGHMIRIQRRMRGMSQHELSRRLGVTFQQVQKYEKGKSRIAASRLYDVARTMGLPVETFFNGLHGGQSAREAVFDLLERYRVVAPQFGFHEFMDLNRAFIGIRNRPIQVALLRLIEGVAGNGPEQPPTRVRQEPDGVEVAEVFDQARQAARVSRPHGHPAGESGDVMQPVLHARSGEGETVG